MKMKRIMVNLPEKQYDRLVEKADDSSALSLPEYIRTIIDQHLYIPAYAKQKPQIDPKERAKQKIIGEIEAKEFKRNQEKQAKLDIANELGGEVTADGHCKYKMYQLEGSNRVDISMMKEPLEFLNEETLVLQFRDGYNNTTGPEIKEKILKILEKNGKK